MWVYEEDRDFIKIAAAKEKISMADLVKEMRKSYVKAD